MLITVSQDVHCRGVEYRTTNRHDRCVPRSEEEMETGGNSASWSLHSRIYHKGQDNWPHTAKSTPLLFPSLADKQRNSAPCWAKWWLV